MRRGIFTVGFLLAVVFAGIASARTLTSPPISPGPISPGPVAPVGDDGAVITNAKAVLSTTAAGAPAALTLRLHGELQCGRPQGHRFVVHLPAAMSVPASIGRADVSLVGAVPLHVGVKAHDVTVTAGIRRGAICNVLGPGWFSIVFRHDAGLRNPAGAGSYAFTVSGLPGGRWHGMLTVS